MWRLYLVCGHRGFFAVVAVFSQSSRHRVIIAVVDLRHVVNKPFVDHEHNAMGRRSSGGTITKIAVVVDPRYKLVNKPFVDHEHNAMGRRSGATITRIAVVVSRHVVNILFVDVTRHAFRKHAASTNGMLTTWRDDRENNVMGRRLEAKTTR
jgi:hypothetical protein